MKNYFYYKDSLLMVEEISVKDIADQIGTPFYCYSSQAIIDNYNSLATALAPFDSTICYAVKANPNLAVLHTLAQLGAGADCVSAGEIRRAITSGITPKKIVFSGVGKTKEEIEYAIEQEILQFNVESLPELELINQIASEKGKIAHIAFRVNPDVEAGTHHKITTGKKENKFGIDWQDVISAYNYAATLPAIKIQGISMHIGSQITSIEPYQQAFMLICELISSLKSKGCDIKIVDLGGGFGIKYNDESVFPLDDYAKMVEKYFGNLNCKLIFEPGRYLVGNAGIMVSKVLYNKLNGEKRFVIIDAAMNDLMRPSLYDAYHQIVPIKEDADEKIRADIVGPVCESSDVLAYHRFIPDLQSDYLIAFKGAGAYGASMSSTYNTRPLIAEVMVTGSKFRIVRRRPSFEEMLSLEII